MDMDIDEGLKNIGIKIGKIKIAMEESIEESDDEEITVTEYEMIKKISNIEESYMNLINNYNLSKSIKNNEESEEIEKATLLACSMMNFYLDKTARALEITV